MEYSGFIVQANLIDGAWVASDSGRTVDVTDPATGKVIGRVKPRALLQQQRKLFLPMPH
jgi:succinate-semialdehyde dehydrogenase/glutarate-semialdehyde dehydrogenase